MWYTQLGDRTLAGLEAAVFREGLSRLLDEIASDREYEIGVAVFDRLSVPEKWGVLDLVARGLLVEPGTPPELTAVNEGAVAAVYYQLLDDLELETGMGRSDIRRLVREACRECHALEGLCCRNMDDWMNAVDALMNRILWDCDWEVEYIKPDDPPDMAGVIREYMGVDADYYTAVAPDPNPAQLAKIKLSLRELCGDRAE